MHQYRARLSQCGVQFSLCAIVLLACLAMVIDAESSFTPVCGDGSDPLESFDDPLVDTRLKSTLSFTIGTTYFVNDVAECAVDCLQETSCLAFELKSGLHNTLCSLKNFASSTEVNSNKEYYNLYNKITDSSNCPTHAPTKSPVTYAPTEIGQTFSPSRAPTMSSPTRSPTQSPSAESTLPNCSGDVFTNFLPVQEGARLKTSLSYTLESSVGGLSRIECVTLCFETDGCLAVEFKTGGSNTQCIMKNTASYLNGVGTVAQDLYDLYDRRTGCSCPGDAFQSFMPVQESTRLKRSRKYSLQGSVSGLSRLECVTMCHDTANCLAVEFKTGRVMTQCNMKSAASYADNMRSKSQDMYDLYDRRLSCP